MPSRLPMDVPAPADLKRRRFAVSDVVRMVEAGIVPEDERLEVIDGEIVAMWPKGYRHEGLKGAINRLWGSRCPDGFDFMPGTGLYLADDVYLEPDFVVFRSSVPLRDLRGADVLLAIEVADSSLRYDLRVKPPVYAAHGVRELWVIDVEGHVTHVHREPGSDGYGRIEPVSSNTRLVPIEAPADLAFALDDLPVR